jgi:DNA-nicking Smr family endonuclease
LPVAVERCPLRKKESKFGTSLIIDKLTTSSHDSAPDDSAFHLVSTAETEQDNQPEALMDEPIEMPIDGVLDLHTFKPQDVGDLVPEYLAACLERGILQVRIIHGKGTGALRRTVHAILAKHPDVVSFTLDHPQYGGWGATIVRLQKAANSKSKS